MNPLHKQDAGAFNARRLMWWSDRQLATLEILLDEARQKWLAAWIDDVRQTSFSVPKVSCRMAHDALSGDESRDWHPLSQSSEVNDENQVWIDVRQPDDGMAQLLLKSSSSLKTSSLVDALCTEAFADCIAEIKTVLALPAGDASVFRRAPAETRVIPVAHSRPWSGAVRVVFPLDDALSIALHLGPKRMAALVKTTGAKSGKQAEPITTLNEALAGHATRLRVELAAVDISVGNLASLTVGDVLVLPHPLTQTLHVKTEDGQSLCHGYLGQLQGQRAIELVKPVSAH